MAKKQFLTPTQAEAANPNNNVWVQANAGTGKTSVLVQRLLKILFHTDFSGGAKNSGILCLTYTNAGAGEMRNRILRALREWATASDDELSQILQNISYKDSITADDIKSARKVFYTYIDNPDILKVKTIHGFCEEVLHRFPTEAGISPSWGLIQDSEQKILMRTAFENLINKPKSADEQLIISNAFEKIVNNVSENFLGDLIQLLTGQYKYFFKINNVQDYREKFSLDVFNFLNLDSAPDMNADINSLQDILEWAITQSKPPKYILKIIELTDKFIKNEIDFDVYKKAYLTASDTPIVNVSKKDELISEQTRVYEINQYKLNQTIFENTMALFDLSSAFATAYKKLKMEKNILDFDDMILYTRKLFSDSEMMGWVLSQLDISINHILVDEAQDTNPEQWDILKSLSENFFVDGNSADNPHGLFVVGDSKQSIYGFQGADELAFAKSRDEIIEQIRNNYRDIREIPLDQSFRSTAPILNTVDYFFSNEKVRQISNFSNNTHKCFRQNDAGIVELHSPMLKIDDTESDNPEVQNNQNKNLQNKYITTLADKIQDLIQNKNIQPNEIMILVQRRRPYAAPLLNELKKRNIPVEGSDRIKLPEFPAVRDLLNLIRFCINNDDEYSLACVLKSPLYRLNENDIYKICKKREDLSKVNPTTIFDVLAEFFPDIKSELDEIIVMSKSLSAYSFFTTLFNKYNFKDKIIAALGQPVLEPINEFMTICLAYERTRPGTLRHFLKWFITGGSEIKRDMSAERGIRIVTVHGSKGLEAKVVFLIDTFKMPGRGDEKILPIDSFIKKSHSIDNFSTWIWRAKSSASESEASAIDAKMDTLISEYYRLLYVAMTRARDQLYIYGSINQKNMPENSWFTVLYEILGDMPGAIKDDNKITVKN